MAFKILVVDDSITIQKIVAMAFENEDAVVEGVCNGSEALVKLKEYRPDIILADVDMSGINGFDLSKKIKNSKEFSSVSVLLLTSDFGDFNEDHIRESLADDQITKPFKSEDIVSKVIELLKRQGSSAPVPDDEDVIALSQTDRVNLEEFLPENEEVHDRKSFANLEKDPPMNFQETFSAKNEEAHLELSDQDMLIVSENSEHEELMLELEEEEEIANLSLADENPDAAFDPSPETPAKSKDEPGKAPEETLEGLIRKVEALSNKSRKFHDEESKALPLNTLDEVIKDVNALKSVPSPANQGDNGKGPSSLDMDNEDALAAKDNGVPSHDNANERSLVAEASYISEENADELEAAFQEILNANKGFSPNLAAIAPEEQNDREGEDLAPAHETLLDNFTTAPVADSFENFDPEVEIKPAITEDHLLSEEESMATEESFKNISEFPGSQVEAAEELSHQLMGAEIKELLEQSMTSSMEKEISGLSDKIIKSVEKIVREVVPDLTKTIINREAKRIKNKGNR